MCILGKEKFVGVENLLRCRDQDIINILEEKVKRCAVGCFKVLGMKFSHVLVPVDPLDHTKISLTVCATEKAD